MRVLPTRSPQVDGRSSDAGDAVLCVVVTQGTRSFATISRANIGRDESATVAVDTLSPSERSARMGRVRGRDTGPEMMVRRLLHRMGYRYQLHRKDLPGRPDIVFGQRRKVIFIHGCFWHRHADPACRLGRLPKSRLEFWEPKLAGNALRDARHQEVLHEMGWDVLVVWECELRHSEQLENKLRQFVEG